MGSFVLINERYSLRSILSAGPGSEVYLAEDRRTGRPVALKLLPARQFEDSRELEHLARLTALRHPNLLPVLDHGRVQRVRVEPSETTTVDVPAGSRDPAGPLHREPGSALIGSVLLVTPFLEALDLTAALRQRTRSGEPAGKPLDRWLSGVLLQVLDALQALHELRLLHFDIKPEHILVQPEDLGGPLGSPRAYLIDLGLLARASTPLGNRIRGTFPYIAPEVLDQSLVDERVDLYSLGATIYHSLTGGALLASRTRRELEALNRRGLPPLSEQVKGLPPHWEQLIARLTDRDPARRPDSAASLHRQLRARWPEEPVPDCHCSLRPLRLGGQEKEYDYILRELEKLRVGENRSSLILVGGNPGVGKRVLTARLMRSARLRGIETVRVRCQGPHENPLGPVVRLLSALRNSLVLTSPLWERLDALLRWAREGWLPEGLEELSEPTAERYRWWMQLSDLLLEMDREHTYLFVFEDLEHAAPECLEFLGHLAHRLYQRQGQRQTELVERPWQEPTALEQQPACCLLRPPAETARHILLVGIVDEFPRTGQHPPGRLLDLDELASQQFVTRITLQSLNPVRSRELLREVVGHVPQRIHSELTMLSHGHGNALLGLILECQRYGLLVRRDAGWQWDPEANEVGAALAARRTAAWLDLTPADHRLLALLALQHGALEEDVALQALQRSCPDEGAGGHRQRLSALEAQGWLARDEADPGHPILRLLSADLPATPHEHAALRTWALRVAAETHGAAPGDPVAATWAWIQLRAPAEASVCFPRALALVVAQCAPWTLLALVSEFRATFPHLMEPEWWLAEARAARECRQEARALTCLEALLAAAPPAHLRVEGLLLLAQLQRSTPGSQEQVTLEQALQAATELGDRDLQAQALLELGRRQLRLGAHEVALHWARTASELLAAQPPGPAFADLTRTAQIQLLLADVYAGQNLHERARRALQELLATDDLPHRLSASWTSRVLTRLAQIELNQSRYDAAIDLLGRCLPLDRGLGDYSSAAQTLSSMGRIHVSRGEKDLAGHYHQRALQVRLELHDLEGVAASKNNIGLVYKMQSRRVEAEACFRGSVAILEQLELRGLQAVALNNLSDVMLSKGDYPLALRYAFQGLELRREADNPAGLAFSYYRIATIYRCQGELEQAWDYAEKALARRRELGDRLNLAYSLEQCGELLLLRGKHLEALRCLRQSLSNFEALGDRLGHQALLALLGDAHRQLGQYEEARQRLEQSLAIAQEHAADYYTAISQRGLGALSIDTGELSAAETQLAAAERLFRAQESRRELAQVLLERTRLSLDLGDSERGLAVLAEAHTILEELRLLDLFPTYYRLRALVALRGGPGEAAMARTLLERGLEESRRLDLPEETWRLLLALARCEGAAHAGEEARAHLAEAIEMVSRLRQELPEGLQASYVAAPERAELVAESEHLAAPPAASPQVPETRPLAPSEPVATPPVSELLELQEIALLLSTSSDLNSLLEKILDTVMDLFGAERGFLILYEQEQPTVRLARHMDPDRATGTRLEYSHSIADEVWRAGRLFITNDAQQDERLREASSVRDLRLQAIACFPLEWHGDRLGVIYLENRFRKQLVRPDQVRLVRAFSNQAAVSIMNARLLDESQRRRTELEASQQHVQELNRRLEQRVEEQTRALAVAHRRIERTQEQLAERFQFHRIIGKSPQMLTLYRLLERVAETDLPVLIEGESGTGKELVAHAIHFNSARRRGSFVSENCGALSESLIESELFGHRRGAFTGADNDREGLIAIAEGGTLFLDEVHELSLDMQKKLLRFLQEGVYRPVGGEEFHTANVRILSACNRPLRQLAQEGRFREDLYYRLNVLRVELPPLRARDNDILLLARHFLDQVTEREQLEPRRFSEESLARLTRYRYPGNVRELRNVVEKAAVLARSAVIEPHEIVFDEDLSLASGALPVAGAPLPTPTQLSVSPLREARELFQRHYLEDVLARHGGVVARAARHSGITRESFHRLMKKYGVERLDAD